MPTRHRWSLVVPVVGLVVAVVLLPLAASDFLPVNAREAFSYLVTWVPLIMATVVSVVLARRRQAEPWWSALRLPVTATGVLLGVFIGLAVRTLGVLAEAATTGRIGGGALLSGSESSPVVALAAVIVASVLIAPVIEEAFFRGALLPAVEERVGAGRAVEWIAIVLVAAVFAGVHALTGTTVVAAVVTFVAGIGFGAVARSSGVGAAVVAHAIFNASGIALTLSSSGLSPLPPTLGLG